MTHDEALAQLKDISPMDASWWQALLEWLMIIGGAAIILGLVLFLTRLIWKETRKRQPVIAVNELRQTLETLARHGNVNKENILLLMGCLKMLAIRQAGRDAAAGLEGDAWLAWLDEHAKNGFAWQRDGGELLKQLYHPNPPPSSSQLLQQAAKAGLEWLTRLETPADAKGKTDAKR